MRVYRSVLVAVLLAAAAPAQDLRAAVEGYLLAAEGDSDDELAPVLVTASRSPEVAFETPYSAESVTDERVRRQQYRTVPQVLRDVPGVFVQETATGQGSPFIRGFTGYLNLFLIDGIRLNNSVFRPGPNQYWSTVDPFSIARLEIVKGSSSVLYGSDAVGGTVQAITRSPYRYGEGWSHGGRLFVRGSTAEQSFLGRGEVSIGRGDRTGALLGVTGKSFGDLVAGGDVGTQENTDYDEWDVDAKVEHFLDDDTSLVLAYQHVQQNNVPRTHRTVFAESFHGTDVGTELQRDLDQERQLLYVQFHDENLPGAVERLRASVSWHVQDEIRDRIRPPSGGGTENRRDKQGIQVGTLGAWILLESATAIGRLTYGAEYYHDNVNSFSTRNPVQGPVADEATYDLLSAYVQDVVELTKRLVLTVGARVTYAAADADSVSDPETGARIGLDDDWIAVVGNVRLRYDLVPDAWNVYGGVAQAFRAPNLSDLTRFDSARSNEFEIPAPGLDPEHYVTFEVGLKGQRPRLSVLVSVFYTRIDDQIIRVPTGDTTTDGEEIVTKGNVGDGYVYGVELGGAWEFAGRWTLFGNLTYIEGRVDTFATSMPVTSREYLDRLMPLTAQVGVRFEEPDERFWAELVVVMADRADRLSPRDASDTQRIPPGGTPGYAVVHLRGGWKISERARVVLGIENVFDKGYRVHGSGHNMAGLNFVLSATLDF